MKYRVTIGIPVYKSVDFIRRALESALSQTYESIEFLIIDDGGSDGSMDVVHQFMSSHSRGKHITVISHSSNLGVSVSRNEIIDSAQGDFLYFLDSDDVMAGDTISLMMRNIEDYEAEIVFGSYEKIEVSGGRVVYQYPLLHLLEADSLANFAYRKYAGMQASACNYLVKTSLLRGHHLRFIDVNYWEDLVFTFNLVTKISRAVLLPDITYTYLCHKGSLSHYQIRPIISKDEILQNIRAVDYLKKTSVALRDKVYFPKRCYNIVMTDLYIACNIIKRRHRICPSFSDDEIRTIMAYPASLRQIWNFKQFRTRNLFLYSIGKFPAHLCVRLIWCFGKLKKLI